MIEEKQFNHHPTTIVLDKPNKRVYIGDSIGLIYIFTVEVILIQLRLP